MIKRTIAFLLIFVAGVLIVPYTVLAAGNLSNFTKTRAYTENQFTDVSDQWFAPDVQLSYEYALVDGTSPTTFSPEKFLTIAEAIKFAACLNIIYNTGISSLQNGDPLWYQTYVDYALAHGIIQAPYPDYTALAARSDMAVILAKALPDEALTPINNIADGEIPDVSMNYTCSTAIYTLYRAGILTGTDDTHAYKPNDLISRAEAVAIVTRLASSGSRKSFSISSADDIQPPNDAQTTEYTITAAPSTVLLESGAQSDVSFTVSALDFDKIVLITGNPSIISCTWGIPKNNTIPLTVFGLSAGSTDITVRLLDNSNNILAETAVDVVVTGSVAETAAEYYEGYYPVPDYGVYTETAPNYIDYDILNSSIFYTYKISDITFDMAYAVNGYVTQLMLSGFLYDYSFESQNGDEIFVYIHSDYHLKVFFTCSEMNQIPSIIIRITPF